MKPEFKLGTRVTFKPYENKLSYLVNKITRGSPLVDGDTRIFYHLGRNKGFMSSITTGRCIMESELYEPWDEKRLS